MIYIVRHGQTDWNLLGINAGRTDIDINETGIKQAKEMQEKLKDIKFDYVFSSPLIRAYHTASIITEHDIIKDDRIIERCNGELEGKTKEEIPTHIDFNDPNCGYGIESIIDFRKRIYDFFNDIINNYEGNILVVTHAGVSIYARCFFEGEPEDYKTYKLKNCEYLKYKN